MSTLIEYPIEHGGTVVVEIPDDDGMVRAARPGEVAARVNETLEDALSSIQPAAAAVLAKLRGLKADEIKVEFGVKLSTVAGAVIASASTEAHFVVALTWKSAPAAPTTPEQKPG